MSISEFTSHRCLIALLAMILVSCAEREVFATCGDWLTMGRHDASQEGESDVNGELLSVDRQPPVPERKQSPSPCHGPLCRNNKSIPPLPPSPSQRVVIVRLDGALWLRMRLHSEETFCGKFSERSSDMPAGYPASIDRPPRFQVTALEMID
jgi:hypothetical protein